MCGMAFQLDHDEPIGRGLRRRARGQTRSAANALESPGDDRNGAVHDARRSVKKARAILKMMADRKGGDLRRSRKRLRKVSRRLAPFRDADASVEILQHLRDRAPRALPEHTFGVLRRALVADRERLLQRDWHFDDCIRFLRKSRKAAGRWRSKFRLDDVIEGMQSIRMTGRRATETESKSNRAQDGHRWRIAAKKLWYQLRLLEGAGRSIAADVKALKQLEDGLGEEHNLVVLCSRLFGDQALVRTAGDLTELRAAASEYQEQLREKALTAGKKIYGTDDARFLARVKRDWQAWRRRPQPAAARSA